MPTVTPEALIYLFIALVVLAVCSFAYCIGLFRLTSTARRVATAMLLAQLLIIAVGLWHRPLYVRGWSVWHLDYELNIPTALATAQLALVATTALISAWLSPPRLYRAYLFSTGILFLFLAWEEFFPIRNSSWNWAPYFTVVGVTFAGITAIVAALAPKPLRIWHICMLAGLALSGAGALGLEQLRYEAICTELGFWKQGRCMFFAIEETLEFLGIWLTSVSVLGQLSQIKPVLPLSGKRLLLVLPGLVFLVLMLFSSRM